MLLRSPQSGMRKQNLCDGRIGSATYRGLGTELKDLNEGWAARPGSLRLRLAMEGEGALSQLQRIEWRATWPACWEGWLFIVERNGRDPFSSPGYSG